MGNDVCAWLTSRHGVRFTWHGRFQLPDEAAPLPSGQLLVGGGNKLVEIYDPGARGFLLATGQLSDASHFMIETRLNDGSVLLAGGYANNDQATAQAWIYRP